MGKFWLFKKHYNKRYFSTSVKAKKMQKNDHFEWLLTGPSKGYLTGPSLGTKNKANLDQLITIKIVRAII